MINRISPEIFLEKATDMPVLDVRSPQEYTAGHIPEAINFPLFTDFERKEVGILYRQNGREASILKGLEFVGPRLSGFVIKARQLAPGRNLLIHCWRGGMRSENMAWLLDLAGFNINLLEGGYKAYRRYIREQLGIQRPMIVLGGKTGSGKSGILHSLEQHGQQVLKLEELARHRGSAFGALGQEPQPANEQFENDLFHTLRDLNAAEMLWIEDESRAIGRISIPEPFFKLMRSSRVLFIDVPLKSRVKRLVEEYSGFEPERLASAITRIGKRLGGQNEKIALEALNRKEYEVVAEVLLHYYDKAYLKGLSMRDQETVYTLPVDGDDPGATALRILNYAREKSWIPEYV